MRGFIKENWVIGLLFVIIIIFARYFIVNGLLPIPSDTIIGLYHPFRDLYVSQYPNGVPYKNFLITDPVRQTYIWKEVSVSVLKNAHLPLWNPYEMAGKPLLSNFQSSPLYPLNVILFIKPFSFSWSLFILIQPLLAGLFMYWYLRNFKLYTLASVFGAIAFAFSGFAVAWLEWGNVLHTALWLPFILLSIDKINFYGVSNLKLKSQNSKSQFKNKKIIVWSGTYIFTLACALLAGHLQVFFYLFVLSQLYWLVRWNQYKRNISLFILFLVLNSWFLVLTSIQWVPTLQFILNSAREADQAVWQKDGWFIPWQHLIQFIAPDFFGNPSTLNYWGVWNYGELVGYIGIIPLVFAVFALFVRMDKKTWFFGLVLLISFIFALPTPLSKLPFILSIPFLSTAQPTRLIFLIDFCLAILAAFGLDYYMRKHIGENSKDSLTKFIFSAVLIGLVLVGVWVFVLYGSKLITVDVAWNLAVSKKNVVLPTALFGMLIISIFITLIKPFDKLKYIVLFGLVILTALDLLRFASKFTQFTSLSDKTYFTFNKSNNWEL